MVLDDKDMADTVALLTTLPFGVLAMSPDVPGLVQTSTNLATVKTKGDVVEIITSQRSSLASSKMAAARVVATTARLAAYEVENSNSYPGWKPEPDSDLVRKLQEVHQRVFGRPAKLIAMHAGLECGVIGEKYPGMQLISFGPTIVDPHSPYERVKISSVENFWNYLRSVLESL
jgi:dipeptidase D